MPTRYDEKCKDSLKLTRSSQIVAQAFPKTACDSVNKGYQCRPEISHYWGQYSPYFSVPATSVYPTPPNILPPTCRVTFAQVLSRHGARSPTASKTKSYNSTIQQIHTQVREYGGRYAFLQDYKYTLGADSLTRFGQQEMINSGIKFYDRYRNLAQRSVPFIRASSEQRVVESGQNFSQGFHSAKRRDFAASLPDEYPYAIVEISEADGSNNTLNHGLCTDFEDGPDSSIASSMQSAWANVFVPPIQARINADLPGANLSQTQIIYLMDLCPFNTVASDIGAVSPFCDLFTVGEWKQYGYYESLNKFYGYGNGNPLGPTQGVGFANELIARMSDTPVVDHTSVNHTLDGSDTTFPLGLPLYADFSHDNDMTAIFSALGLYNKTAMLSNTSYETIQASNGYSAALTVPFAARAYFEKLSCLGEKEELVRISVNDRIIPLQNCGADFLGRCRLSAWIGSLSFVRGGGHWDQCFI